MSAWELDSPIKASRWQQGLVAVCHLLAFVAITVAYLPWWAKALIAVAVLLSALHSWRMLARQHADAIAAFSTEEGHWYITLNNGQRLRVALKSWAVWRYLVVLDLQSTSLRLDYRLLIFPDSVGHHTYRRLQARLRLAALTTQSSILTTEV